MNWDGWEWVGWGAGVLVPLGYAVLARQRKGFAQQHSLAQSGNPLRFADRVEAVGGATAVRTGVWLDLGFIATLTVPPGIYLSSTEHPALVGFALSAAAVDLVEDLLLLRVVRTRSATVLRTLRAVSTAKLVAYGAMWAAVVVVALTER